MKSLTNEESFSLVCPHFLTSGVFEGSRSWPVLPLPGFFVDDRTFPSDSGKKVVMAKEVVRQFSSGDFIIWIRNWSVWPSSSHLPLINRLRAC